MEPSPTQLSKRGARTPGVAVVVQVLLASFWDFFHRDRSQSTDPIAVHPVKPHPQALLISSVDSAIGCRILSDHLI